MIGSFLIQNRDAWFSLKRLRPKVKLTATSFPEYVADITISNVEELLIEGDTIAALDSLKNIKFTNIDTLTLLPRSMARVNQLRSISVDISKVKSLEVHKEAFSQWGNSQSRVSIADVDNCQMLHAAVKFTKLSALFFHNVTNLSIGSGAFSESSIGEIRIAEARSVSISSGAFTSNVTAERMITIDVDTLILDPEALSQSSTIQEAVIERVHSLRIAPGGIEADIDMLTIRDATMTTCEENTFGGMIKSMSLSYFHINNSLANCISADTGWKKLIVDNCYFAKIEPLAIHGSIEQVEIKQSFFGVIEGGGLTLNTTGFSVQRNTFEDLSDRALEVHATRWINLTQCTINVLRKDAFSSLNLEGGAKNPVRMENFEVKTPENGSMHFAREESILILRLKLHIPCTCTLEDMEAVGLVDMGKLNDARRRRQSLLLYQVRCKSDSTWSTLGEYHLEFCPHTTTTTTTTTTSTTMRPSTSMRPSTTLVTDTSVRHAATLKHGTYTSLPAETVDGYREESESG
ncbi:uncharacterized protein LOC122378722 isoform X2 [Amphibalanus amphitrite]|uniref:uncharacterized protein LOC122378722 isoform X2 n=1 Tax=Amphibalanus amphitrite TaxID=1232801 RepID=UPI001C90DCDC|nr:uncharacterized protein LOC122378722 isoform X2 [Amphibalanus amphitrite]